MGRKLSVHLLPDLCPPEILRGGTSVVIDVLRASSTIVTGAAEWCNRGQSVWFPGGSRVHP